MHKILCYWTNTTGMTHLKTRGVIDTSRCVTAERVNKWPKSMLARCWYVPFTRIKHQPYLPVTECRHSYIYATPELRNFEKVKNGETITFLNARSIFRSGNESTIRRRWLKNTVGRQHRQRGSRGAADPLPPCRSLHFKWSPLQKRIYLTGYTLISNLGKFRPRT